MNNPFHKKHPRLSALESKRIRLTVSAALLSLLLTVCPSLSAQNPDGSTTVTNISTAVTPNNTLISINANGPITRAQTWQDKEGFHVVIPEAGTAEGVRPGKGVNIRRIGSSVEILLQLKPGATVSVQSLDNRVTLTVDGRLEDSEIQDTTTSGVSPSSTYNPAGGGYSSSSPFVSPATSDSLVGPNNQLPPSTAPVQGPIRDAGEYSAQEVGNDQDVQLEDDGVVASLFSTTSVLVILALAIFSMLVLRRVRSRRATANPTHQGRDYSPEKEVVKENQANAESQSTALVRSNRSLPANGASRKATARPTVTTPASLYGAYRIDQEVGKLVLGLAHRMDVLASRATDDRRAIEASLLKVVVSPESSDDERRRARGALEEYGFVARQCASLLFAGDPFERTSAARSLGEIGSSAALPFLLESLHDVESIVRNQAVVSIGELKVPSAIGALLDMARNHPDVPSSLVSRALSSCSVEGLDFFDAVVTSPLLFASGLADGNNLDLTQLESPAHVEDLPESSDDERFTDALSKLESAEPDERIESAKTLADFAVQKSVQSLMTIARNDPESSVRATAVAGLAFINHESVFPAVLLALADDSREVRAAAARGMSRLNFDRSDAYVRLLQTSDEQTLKDVAASCVKAGIVEQNIDRLASGDRRQGYEVFALICLLAKAKQSEAVIEAIATHSNLTVRLNTVHLLASTCEPDVFEQLQKLALRGDVPEEVRTGLLEAMYRLEQTRPKQEEPVEEFVERENAFDLISSNDADEELDDSIKVDSQNDEVEL